MYGVIFFLVALSGTFKKECALGYLTGILLAAVLMLLITPSLQGFFEQFVEHFDTPEQRLRRTYPFLFIPTWLMDHYWLGTVIVLWSIRKNWEKLQPLVTLFACLMPMAVYCAVTGTMKMSANIPLMGIHSALGFALIYSNEKLQVATPRKITRWIPIVLLMFLTIWQITESAKRGLRLDTWTYGNQDPFGDYALKSEPLNGWMVHKESGEAVDELTEFIKRNVPQNERLLVLTDLQILYALTGRDSYRGVPFIFHVGAVPTIGRQLDNVRTNILANPPEWIVTHRESDLRSFVSAIIAYLGLTEFVKNNYFPVFYKNNYAILRHR